MMYEPSRLPHRARWGTQHLSGSLSLSFTFCTSSQRQRCTQCCSEGGCPVASRLAPLRLTLPGSIRSIMQRQARTALADSKHTLLDADLRMGPAMQQARPLGTGLRTASRRTPHGAGVLGVVVAALVLDLSVELLHAAAHGVRVVDVDVVVLPARRLLHKRLLDLHACSGRAGPPSCSILCAAQAQTGAGALTRQTRGTPRQPCPCLHNHTHADSLYTTPMTAYATVRSEARRVARQPCQGKMRSNKRCCKPGRTAQLHVVLRLDKAGRVLPRLQPVAVDGDVVRHWDTALLRAMHGSQIASSGHRLQVSMQRAVGALPHHSMLL
jgi:hypothetical protein